MLYNKLVQFFVLFILAFVLVNPIAKKGDIESKAEVLITIDWSSGDHDVDLWCRDPAGKLVWFQQQEAGAMHLDRDDLGNLNDYVTVDGKSKVVNINREIISVRSLVPGEYVCNVFLYGSHNHVGESKHLKEPVDVHTEVQKLNPKVQVVFSNNVQLSYLGQEITVVRFNINKHNNVVNINTMQVQLTQGVLNKSY